MNATGPRERANNGKLKRLLAEAMLDSEPLSAIGPRTMASALKDLLSKKW